MQHLPGEHIVCALYVTPYDKTSCDRCILKYQVEGVLAFTYDLRFNMKDSISLSI